MANEDVRALIAKNRDVPDESPKSAQDCRDVIHIAIFFDGTGNNDEIDRGKRKWSNVARLYHAALLAAQADTSGTLYPVYIAGVGTKFNGRAADWIAAASAWIEDGFPGAGAGSGGDRRLEHASDMVNLGLREILIANAKALGGRVAEYAERNSEKSFSEVAAALSKHRLIKIINLSIFGFSRGAALARAFSNRLIQSCKKDGKILLYDGYPLRINFVGVFDTVASFGVPAQNARTPFSERELIVSGFVERCVHFVAAHELRFSFPVDLIRKNGALAGNWLERVYPGVHSDIGGGYEPVEQGIDNNYARIPMLDMMKESLLSGVRILSYDDIKKRSASHFAERFECRRETAESYRSYMAALPSEGGPVEAQIKNHLKLYYSANGAMDRQGLKNVGDRRRDANRFKYVFGSKGMASDISLYRSIMKAGKLLRLSERNARGLAQYVEVKDWQIAAWDTDPPQPAIDFVARYVHDSKVDFMGNIEPFTYFRPRGVEESSISVWTEGGNWIRGKIDTVVSAGEATKEKVVNAAEQAAEFAKQSAEAAQRKAIEAADYANRKADEAAAAANAACDTAARSAREAAAAARQRAEEAAKFARRKASEAADASAKAYEGVARSSRQAVTTAKRQTDELRNDTKKIFENGIRWAERQVDELRDLLD